MTKLDYSRERTNRKLYPANGYKEITPKQKDLLLKLGVEPRKLPKSLQGASNMIDRLLDAEHQRKKRNS
jgi:hypothetical protein